MSSEPILSQDESEAAQIDAADIAATLEGDGEAYRRLIQRYQGEIALQMRRFSRDLGERDELVHDVFVEAYRSLPSYRGTSPWLHWLRKIAVRIGYRSWRQKRGREGEVVLSPEDWDCLRGRAPPPEDAVEAAELVHAVLAQLAPSDRLVLTLMYLDGCTMAEIASRAGWTLLGTKLRAFRARNRLRKLLEEGAT